MFPYLYNLYNLEAFDEKQYFKSISDSFKIEFKKEPIKTLPHNLDRQVCGYAIL